MRVLETVIKIPINLFELPEFIKLEQLASNGRQERTAQALWLRLACIAGRAGCAGYVTGTDQPALTNSEYAHLAHITRANYVPQLLALLEKAGLLQRHADDRYQISHWERYAVDDVDPNYCGLVKFYDVDDPQPAPPAPPLTGVTPLALQKYTPAQRAKLVTTTGKILAYLHQQSGKQFSNEPATQILLAGLFDQKVTIKQIKQVIDWKCKDWYETDFWKFVRPQTLFGPKFKQYLLEAPPPAHVQPAAQLTRTQYLRDLYQLSCGDVAMVLRRAADEVVDVTEEEVEAIGRDLGY
ncbi:conserved phage C-terminal domain-containing protein [Loigolactobacillus coryniformis]|uniref:conserved phage C-terminal domain-containing protein n=1 Tax=Loigolactobacillus coryniformis TaxID=1610 RepID=UPI001CDA9C72|nr:conserved phage C-terminal domain-containing protein [Loigolactobacillus coryniformis]